jgi:two-component system NtrC family sensor kinase
MNKILLIEDEPHHAELIRHAFHKFDPSIEILHKMDTHNALSLIDKENIDLVVVDYRLENTDGISFVKDLRNCGLDVPVVMITGHGDDNTAVEAIKAGVNDFIYKDIGFYNVLPHIYKQLIDRYKTDREIKRVQRLIFRFNEQLMLINSVIKEINQNLDPDFIIDRVLDAAVELSGADASIFCLYEDNVVKKLSQMNISIDEKTIEGFRDSCGEGITFYSVEDNLELIKDSRLKGYICYPMELLEKYRAIILLFFYHELGIDDFDTRSLEIFLESVTSSLRNGILFEIIKRSQILWRSTFDSISEMIVAVNEEGVIIRCNNAFSQVCNKTPKELTGENIFEIDAIPEGIKLCMLPHIKKRKGTFTEEVSCEDHIYLVTGAPVVIEDNERGMVFTIKDITEFRRLKEQLYHTDKLASLGLLVSGVAHELNNPMTGILGYTELLKMNIQDEKIRNELDKIYKSAERCKKIIENLLTFSRQRPPEKTLVQINDLIDSAIELRIYWLRSNNVRVIREYDNIPMLHVDPQQIQQVIMNLLVNAEYAIEQSKKEEKIIRFKTRYDNEEEAILIEVYDNGIGIPDEYKQRIFDPFFTTKPLDKGTGLGLSISHGIVKEHGGEIWCESIPDKGTTFYIKLPVKKSRI